MLTLVYTLSMFDQGLIGILLQPIKDDLHLSDTQLGFLTGIAFGLVYAAVGVPIARWADRGNRSTITCAALTIWGATVMLCLFVTNFVQLVAARIATAVGGAGCMPPTYSMVGDYYPERSERMRAMTIYMLANPLSLLASFIVGGWSNERYGWRLTFFIMGIPALLIAGAMKITVAEPRKHSRQLENAKQAGTSTMAEVLRTLWLQRSSRHLVVGLILVYTLGLGLSPWYAAFMMRSHGMDTAELGVWLGLIFGIGGIAGVSFGGYVADRWLASDERGQLRLIAVTLVLLVPCLLLFLLVPGKLHALLAFIPAIVLINCFFGPAFALMQRLVPDEMRATTAAVVMLLCSLIGMGVGPQVVGLLSDVFAPYLKSDSLRYAMLAISVAALWSAMHFWRAGDTVIADLDRRRLAVDVPPAGITVAS